MNCLIHYSTVLKNNPRGAKKITLEVPKINVPYNCNTRDIIETKFVGKHLTAVLN